MNTDIDPLLKRIPPRDVASERAFLGCCVLDPVTMGGLEVEVKPEWFSDSWHVELWRGMLALNARGVPINPISLLNSLQDQVGIDQHERIAETMLARPLHELADTVPTAVNANFYARQVKDAFLARELAKVGRRITNLAWGEGTLRERLELAESLVHGIGSQDMSAVRSATPSDLMRLVEARLERLRSGDRPGVHSGYASLDDLLTGFQPGEMSLLAGRPSMGKSALMFAMLRRMAQAGQSVGVVSLEMQIESVGVNWLASRAQVDSRSIRDGFLPRVLPPNVQRAMHEIGACDDYFTVADKGIRTVSDLRRHARLWVGKRKIKVLAVDYIQLIRAGGKSKSRYDEVTEVSMGLKAIAQDLGVHVLALAQLNRQVEQRAGNEPVMSDLKESGQLEQDADQIMLIHRPGYYDRDEDPQQTIVTVAKNRHGAVGRAQLRFVLEHNAFYDSETAPGQQHRQAPRAPQGRQEHRGQPGAGTPISGAPPPRRQGSGQGAAPHAYGYDPGHD